MKANVLNEPHEPRGEATMNDDLSAFLNDLLQQIMDLVFNELFNYLMALIFGEEPAA